MEKAHVSITGAAKNMGREFAELFAKGGYSLVRVARAEARSRELSAALTARHSVSVTRFREEQMPHS